MKVKKAISEIINEMQNNLGEIKKESKEKIPQDLIDKYISFKKWLNDNGTIYPRIEFPVLFGNIIGCQAKEEIPPNSCLFFIPYKILIDSSNINIESISPSLNKNNSLKLTLFLIEEYYKKEKSFYKPYIDLILTNDFLSYTPFWENDDYLELNDQDVEGNIKDFINEIEDYFRQVKKSSEKYKSININLFKKFYCFVISRQFNIDDEKMLLVPLGDLLNHSPKSSIKYEFFDSVNYTMKYTNELKNDSSIENNKKVYTDCSDFFKYNKNKISKEEEKKSDCIIVNYEKESNINLTGDDYFVMSTNEDQIFKKGEQVFNNYGECSNEYLLVNFGFCLLNNPGDKTKVIMTFKIEDECVKEFLVENYYDDFINKDSYEVEKYISIELSIKRNKISSKLTKLFRYISSAEKGFINGKKFDKGIEIEAMDKYIEFINKNIENNKTQVFKTINVLKQLINQEEKYNENQFNITSFKLTQKLNLLYQKELISFIKNVLQKSKVKSYEELNNEISKMDNISNLYLEKEEIKIMVGKYLNKLIEPKNNK